MMHAFILLLLECFLDVECKKKIKNTVRSRESALVREFAFHNTEGFVYDF